MNETCAGQWTISHDPSRLCSAGNKNRAIRETGKMDNLGRMGFTVCSVDLRRLGDSIPRLLAAGSAFYHGGKNMQEDYLPDTVGLLAFRRCWLLNVSNTEGEMGLLVRTD